MNVDFYLFEKINQFAGRISFLDNLAVFIADKFGYLLILTLFLFLLKNKNYWLMIAQAIGSAILARLVIVNIIRSIWERPRPFIENNVNLLISHETSGSFPSGHTAFYFAIAVVVYFYNKKLGIIFFIASFLISLARVFRAFIGLLIFWLVP